MDPEIGCKFGSWDSVQRSGSVTRKLIVESQIVKNKQNHMKLK
jgi:hypothetical protein